MKKVRIRAFPRAHVALTDMGRATARAYGGVGFSYTGAETVWELEESTTYELLGIELLDPAAQKDLADQATAAVGLLPHPLSCRLISTAPQHCGYGSKTALVLSLLAGFRVYQPTVTDDQLIRLCQRGGASGIGLHAFFRGGFVWDGGHPDETVDELLPSSARRGHGTPPLLARWEMPSTWRILDLKPGGSHISGAVEKRFFLDNAPIPRQEALETLATICHGVIPAIVCGDLDLLRRSLQSIAATGFKSREIQARGLGVRHVLDDLTGRDAIAAGMSSTGPMIFAIYDERNASAEETIRAVSASHGLEIGGPYSPCHHGHVIEVVSK